MTLHNYVIRFRLGGEWPMGTRKDGVLLDAMTGEPKVFFSSIAASRYGKLSFEYRSHLHAMYATYDVIRVK